MRLLTLNCIILLCVTTTIADESERPKRHLIEWKDRFLAKLFGVKKDCTQGQTVLSAPVLVKQDGDVRIYRMPGYDDILVKAVPKVVTNPDPVVKEIITEDPNIAIIQSYLGTATAEDTVEALEGIRNLLKSGIVLRPRPVVIPDAPRVEPFRLVPAREFVSVPVLAKKVEIVSSIPNHYSYKQFSNNRVTSYTSDNNGPVVVKESTTPLPLPPPYVMDRFISIWRGLPMLQKVIKPALLKPLSPPPQIAGILIPQPVYPHPPVVELEDKIVEVPLVRPSPLYEVPENRVPPLYVNRNCNGIRKGNEPHISCYALAPEKPPYVKVTQTQASIPSSYSYTQFYKDGTSMTHTNTIGNEVNVVKSDKSSVQYVTDKKITAYNAVQPLTNTKEESSINNNSYGHRSSTTETKTERNSSNLGVVYFKKPIPSSYMFKLVDYRDQTRPLTVVRVGDTAQPIPIPSVPLHHHYNRLSPVSSRWDEELSKQYVYISPEMPSRPFLGPVLKENVKQNSELNIPSYYSYKQASNTGAYEYGSNGNVEIKEEVTATSSAKPEQTVSWTSSPISVPDQNFHYQHSNLVGSKMTVHGHSEHGVSAKTEEVNGKNDNVDEKSRGDLPDAAL